MVEERGEDRRNQRSRNDVSWYSRNPQLLASVASIPFPYRPGMFVNWVTTNTAGITQRNLAIPGVMAINWIPTVGYSATATDPASVIGKEIFAKVREKFSGSIDADAPDFVVYLMALDSIFSYIASLKRIYRILTAYTSENHYIPDALLQAMGIPAAAIIELKEHRMQLYQNINELVFMTRKFNIPAVFDIINRHYWLNDNVYMDADSINSQFYIFNCLGYYQFALQTTPGGVKVGGLSMVEQTYNSADTVDGLFQFGRSLIDALAGSDDAYIISGYLMRAYEGTPVFSVDELPIDDKLVPHYDPEVLMQIENSQPIQYSDPLSPTGYNNTVSQDPATNAVLCEPRLTLSRPSWMSSVIPKLENYLSIRSDSPTVADVTIATRLKMGVDDDKSTNTKFDYRIVCGSEILIDYTMWYYMRTGATLVLQNFRLRGVNALTQDASTMNDMPALMVVQSFDWHPIVPVMVLTGSPVNTMIPVMTGDVHNITLLTNEQLKQINRICLYSEFNAYGQI